MNKVVLFTLLFFSLFSFHAGATELQPWFGKNLLIECRTAYLFRHYPQLDSGGSSIPYTANDHFFDLSAAISPLPLLSLEAEVIGADTRQRSLGLDNVRFTARYLLLDDVAALDPISLTIGVTASRATRIALNDLSSFHHGRSEYEFHLAAGKEISCEGFWLYHYWGLFGYGTTRNGDPWMHAIVECERNFWDCHQIGLFANSLWGTGNQDLDPNLFTGYGPINHRSIDLGGRYTFMWECVGTLTLEYSYRVWARNFPSQAQTIVGKLMIPFGF